MDNNSRFNSKQLIDNRQIRVFLSSTFSDMHAERSALVKTFDTLKIEANKRNVNLSLVDLRWGVTDEEARSGKVISVCLNEIEHSHPFFIGLLGNRYGTSPAVSELEKNPDLRERYPWIKQDFDNGLSITEMEIQYGALRNKAEVDAAFFIKNSELSDDNPRLTALKNKIGEQKRYPVSDYSTIDELCEKVEKAVSQVIDKYFPETEVTELERMRNIQRAFINSRHAHYIERQSYFDIIDDFIRSEDNYLVFTGESGMGKSALLANWIKKNEDSDDFNVIYHFIDNPFANNNDHKVVLQHLCDEIYYLYCINRFDAYTQNIDDEMQQLINIVASREQPLVIVIDGINQLDSRNDEKLLYWIPEPNEKVKFIFSTLQDDDTIHFFEDRKCKITTIQPLGQEDRTRFVIGYLENVGKHLESHQLKKIVDDNEIQNTLVLKTLLEELICFGDYYRLEERIDYYLSAATIPEFFDRVLLRMEEDYSAGQNLVQHALILIAISEHGLLEDEIQSILGCRQVDWHLFFCAFFSQFVIKNGLISFSHQHVIDAITKRYHTDDAATTKNCRYELINYFSTSKSEHRSITELAYQYFLLEEWDGLCHILMDYNTFEYLLSSRQSRELLGIYWRSLIEVDKDKYTLVDYLPLLPEEKSMRANALSNLGELAGVLAEFSLALDFFNGALEIKKILYGDNHPGVADLFGYLGHVYADIGDYDKALEYYQKELSIRQKLYGNDHPDVVRLQRTINFVFLSKGNIAQSFDYCSKMIEGNNDISDEDKRLIGYTYFLQGNYPKALEYLNSSFARQKQLYGMENLDTIYTYMYLGQAYQEQGDYSKALEIFKTSVVLLEKVRGKNHPDTANAYYSMGYILKLTKDYPNALEYCFKALEIQKNRLNSNHRSLAYSYNLIGTIYCEMDVIDKAEEYLKKALSIRESVLEPNHPDTLTAYENLGVAYGKQGNWNKALEYLNKSLQVDEKTAGVNLGRLTDVYDEIGGVYYRQHKYQKALGFFIDALEIDDGNLKKKYLRNNIVGIIYERIGEYPKALKYYFNALEITKTLFGDNHEETIHVNESIGFVYNSLGKYSIALEYYKKALQCRIWYIGNGCQPLTESVATYNSLGLIYFSSDDCSKALECFFKELQMREGDDERNHLSIAATYNNIGFVYYRQGDLSNAINYLFKSLEIKENKLGKMHVSTAATYTLLGAVCIRQNNRSKALEYLEFALNIYNKMDPDDENLPFVHEFINRTKCMTKDGSKKKNYYLQRIKGKREKK